MDLWPCGVHVVLTPACGGRFFENKMPIKFYLFSEINFYISIN